MLLARLALGAVVLSTAAIAAAPLVVRRFLRKPEAPDPPVWPKVSVLKPVKGLDPEAREGFVSFIEQDYPGELEVVFGVEGHDDPVLPMIRELQEQYPSKVLLAHSVARADVMGKANNVLAAQGVARGDVYVSADSDVIAGRDDVRRLVRELLLGEARNGMRIGAVGALPVYRGMRDLGAGLMGAYYSPFMAIWYTLKDWMGPRDVFPGTYYAILPEALEAAGGWARIADNIADDYTMGRYLYQAGFESVMSHVIGSVPEPTKSLSQWWSHQHRWNLTYRATMPLPVYLLEPLLHPVALALILPFVLGPVGWWVLGVYCAVRWAVIAWLNAVLLKEPAMWRWLWLMPLSELFITGAWLRSLVQPVTIWRGIPYRVMRGGKLERLQSA
jgi:ceramide glucosyltransferase